MNAASIVVRLSYAGHSVLFTGDTVGRHYGDPADACAAAEAEMVQNSLNVPVQSDVLIVPHHGGDNASSNCFIKAVRPTYAVVSAGRGYEHPRAVTMQRYLDFGIHPKNIFRTDLGDDESILEWDFGRIPGCADPDGDDSVTIVLPATGDVTVGYVSDDADGCEVPEE